MNLALARLGSVLNDYISILFDSQYVYLAYWVGFGTCVCERACRPAPVLDTACVPCRLRVGALRCLVRGARQTR
jgi:hypothetical protein